MDATDGLYPDLGEDVEVCVVREGEARYQPVRRFDEHPVWQKARAYRKALYGVARRLPRDEAFSLQVQIRKAAVSITANFAEGYGRYSFQENVQFCRISRGSVNESLDHLYTCLDESYIAEDEFHRLYEQGRDLEHDLNGYIGFLRREAAKAGRR